MPAKWSGDSIRPCLVPLHTADGAHHSNLDRRHTHLQHAAAVRDGFGAQRCDRKPERLERLKQTRRVVDGRTDEHGKIAREAWRAVKGQRISPDNTDLNPRGSK